MKPTSKSFLQSPAAISLVLTLAAQPLLGATTWTTGTAGDWSTAGNWSPASVPDTNTAGNIANVTLAMTFGGAGFNWTNGFTMNVNSGGSVIKNGTADWVIFGAYGGSGTLNINGGLFNAGLANVFVCGMGYAGAININDGTLRAGTPTGTSGSGASENINNGTIVVGMNDGSSNGNAVMTIGDGTGAAQSAILDLATNNKDLSIGRYHPWASPGGNPYGTVIVKSDGWINSGTGNLIVGNSSSTNASLLDIEGGKFSSNNGIWFGKNSGSRGNLTMNGGTFSTTQWLAIGENGTAVATLSNGAAMSFTTSMAIGAQSTGNGSLTLNDTSTLSLSNNAALSVGNNGGTGTLTLNGASAVNFTNAGSSLVVSNSGTSTGTLTINGTATVTTGSSISLATGSGTATVNQNGGTVTTGSLNMNGSGATYNLSGGTLAVNSIAVGGSATRAFTFSGGGTLKARAASTAFFEQGTNMGVFVGSGGGTIDTNGNDLTINSAISQNTGGGALTKTGNGTLTLGGGGDNISLRSVVNAGTLVLAKPSTSSLHAVGSGGGSSYALSIGSGATVRLAGSGDDQIYDSSAVQLTGGTFDLNGHNETFDTLVGTSGTVTNTASTTNSTLNLGANNGSGTFSGNITNGNGSIAIAKSGTGTLTLAGSNSHGGATTVNGGTLAITGSSSGTGAITVAAGANLTVGGPVAASAVTMGAGGVLTISGSGSLGCNITMAPTAVLDASAHTGAVVLGSGQTLLIGRTGAAANDLSGNLTTGSGSALNVAGTGTVATLTQTGDLTLAGGTVNLDLSPSATSGNDIINVSGTLDLNAPTTIAINRTGGALALGNYVLIQAANVTGSVANVTATGLISGSTRQSFNLSATAVPNALSLVVSGQSANLVWNNAAASGIWSSSAADANWNNITQPLNPDRFYDGDVVSFQDITGQSTQSVALSGSLVPSLVAVSNTASGTAYTLGGTGKITGLASLTKSGNGLLVLNNTGGNDYTGNTTVNAGTLRVGNASALSAGTALSITTGAVIDINGLNVTLPFIGGAGTVESDSGPGTLTASTTGSSTISASLQDGGGGLSLTKTGGGTVSLTGSNSYTGATYVAAGTLQLGNGGTSGTLGTAPAYLDNATLAFNRSDSFVFPNTTLNGASPGMVYQIGTGTTRLTGDLTQTGGTVISAGTLQIGDGGTTGSISGGVVDNATLAFGRSDATSFTGLISGTGGISQVGAGTTTLAAGNTFTGGVSISNGALSISDTSCLGTGTSPVSLNTGGALETPSSFTLSRTITSGGGAISVDSGAALTASGVISGSASLIKSGTGTLLLAASNLFTGDLDIAAGTLAVTADANLGSGLSPIVLSTGGLFESRGSFTLSRPITGAGDVALTQPTSNTANWDISNASNSFSGNWTVNFGRLRFATDAAVGNASNSIIFNGDNVTTFGNGEGKSSLQVTNGVDLNLGAGHQIVLNTGKEGTMYVWSNTTTTLNGKITGGGNLRKEDGGVLLLTNTANDWTGETKIILGELRLGASGTLPDTTTVTIAGGTLNLNGFPESVTAISGGGNTGGIATGNSVLTLIGNGNYEYTGRITDTSSPGSGLTIRYAGTGSLTLSGTADNAGGRAQVDSGTLILAKTSSSGVHAIGTSNAIGLTITGGTAKLAGSGNDQIYTQTNVLMTGGAFDLNGNSEGFRGLTGTAGNVRNDGGAPCVLTIGESSALADSYAYAGSITDGASAINLVKTGSGVQVLSAANSYSGTTTVNGGILEVDNSLTSAITVSSTATLKGSGSTTGTLTVNTGATLAPGTLVGTFSAGNTTLAGTYACDVDGATADRLTVTGSLDLTGSTLTVTTFATPTAASYVIASYTTTLTGTFATVNTLPTGYRLKYDATAKQILLVKSGYDAWAAAMGLTAGVNDGKLQDPDNDGVSNLMEFALGGNPLSPTDNGVSSAAIRTVAGSPALTLTIAVRAGASFASGTNNTQEATIDGITYRIEGTADLATWADTITEIDPLTDGLPTVPTGYEYHSFRTAGPIPTTANDFIRLNVTEAP